MTDAQLALVDDEKLIVAFHHRSWTFKVRWVDGKDVVLEGPVMDKGGRWRPGLRDAWYEIVKANDIPICVSAPRSQSSKRIAYRFDGPIAAGIAHSRFLDLVNADAEILQWRERVKVYARTRWLMRQLGFAFRLDAFYDEIEQLDQLTGARMIRLETEWEDDFSHWLDRARFWSQWNGKPSMVMRYWSDEKIETDNLGLEEIKWVHAHLSKTIVRLTEWGNRIELGELLDE